jgi:hypothetical protein
MRETLVLEVEVQWPYNPYLERLPRALVVSPEAARTLWPRLWALYETDLVYDPAREPSWWIGKGEERQ